MEFGNPWILLGIALIALPGFMIELVRERTRTAAFVFPAPPGLKTLPSVRARLRRLPAFMRFLVLSLLLVALAGPRVPADEVPLYKEGIDIVMVFDISTSMKALDFKPTNRFTVARDTIAEFVKGRKNDRIGLVVFAGQSFTQCPLTLDHAVLLNILSSIKMDVIEDGTAIGDALATAINRLRDSPAKSRLIVLVTDGDNNRGLVAPESAARMAAEFNIRVHTIQVGTGGRVPYPVKQFDPFMQRWIETVQMAQVEVNPQLLRQIADTTHGKFFAARDSDAFKNIFADIDQLEKSELPGEQFVLYKEIYHAFAFPALLILMLEVALRLFWFRKFP